MAAAMVMALGEISRDSLPARGLGMLTLGRDILGQVTGPLANGAQMWGLHFLALVESLSALVSLNKREYLAIVSYDCFV